jgi:F0F1-type ATP synthase assembly protein I
MARKQEQQSDTPKKPGRLAQVRQVFTAARKVDPTIPWWMLLAFVAVVAVGAGIGVLVGHWKYALFLSIPLGLLAATLVLSRRAERAAYRSLEGQPGAAGAALGGLRRGWFYDQSPVAVDGARGTRPEDIAGAAFVYRALGRPGIVLIGEGPDARRTKLLATERKKVERVAPGVPVTMVVVGDAEGQVPVRKVSNKLTRMKPVLTKEEVSAVNKRLKSLGGVRPPIPAGMDPMRTRVDRKAMRGR